MTLGTNSAIQPGDLLTPFVDAVLWEITTNCNLRCTYCSVSLPIYRGEDFDLARIDALTEEFATAKVRMVQISGHGETTMIPGWQEICQAFTRHDINVCITSNFSKMFSDAELDALARMVHITVSIDTVDRELLKNLRRKVDLRTILYNVAMVRLRAERIGRKPHFNWQCTLSDAVIDGLPDWIAAQPQSGDGTGLEIHVNHGVAVVFYVTSHDDSTLLECRVIAISESSALEKELTQSALQSLGTIDLQPVQIAEVFGDGAEIKCDARPESRCSRSE